MWHLTGHITIEHSRGWKTCGQQLVLQGLLDDELLQRPQNKHTGAFLILDVLHTALELLVHPLFQEHQTVSHTSEHSE